MRSQPCLAARPALQRSRCARVNALLLRSDERPLLSRPAPLRKGQSARIGNAPKLACQFEGLVTFRTWGHRSGKLQRRPLRDCPNQACQVANLAGPGNNALNPHGTTTGCRPPSEPPPSSGYPAGIFSVQPTMRPGRYRWACSPPAIR